MYIENNLIIHYKKYVCASLRIRYLNPKWQLINGCDDWSMAII